MKVVNHFKQQPKSVLVGLAVVLVILVGAVDWLTEVDISLPFFFLIPICFSVWFVGKPTGIAVSLLSAVTWLTVELLSGQQHGHPLIPYWNTAVRLGLFLAIASLLLALKTMQETLEEEVEERTAALAVENAERKRTEEQLRDSEQRFRQLAETINEVFWLTNPEKSEMIYISSGYEKIWGRTRDSLRATPRSWLDAIHPEDRERVQQAAITKQISGDYEEEYRIIQPDGAVRWILDRAFPIRDAAGSIYRIAGLAEDITTRKLAEARSAILGHAVESTDQMICITDLQDRFTFVNRAFRECYGYTEPEILGKTPEVVFSPLNPPSLIAEILKQTRLGGWRGEVVDRRKDGTEFPIYLSTSQVKDATGQVVGLMGVAQDITERRRTEEALQAQQREQQKILDSVPALIWYKDCHNRIIRISRSAAESIGKSVAEIEGKQTEEFYPDEAALYYRDDLEVMKSGQPKLGIIERLLTASGEKRWIRTDKVPFRDDCGEVCGIIVCAMDITERMNAEEALRQSEDRLKAIMDNSTAVVYLKDTQGRYLFVNRRYEMLFHITGGQIAGKTDDDVFPKDQAAAFRQNDLQILRAGRALEFEEVVPHDDGLHTYISIKFPLFDAAGQPYAVCGISTDITERKRGEETAQRLAAIVKYSADAIIGVSPDGIVTAWNAGAESLFGYRAEEIVGKSIQLLEPHERAGEIQRLIEGVTSSEKALNIETKRRKKDGTEVEVNITVSAIRGASGMVVGTSAVVRDVTQRKRAEEARARLAAIVESSDDAIISGTLDGTIVSWNKSAEKLYGYMAEEVAGKNITLLYPRSRLAELPNILNQIRQGKAVEHFETVRVRKDGSEVDVSLTISPIRDAAGQIMGVSVIGRNITERKRTEQALQTQARILENMVEGVLVYDEHERILFTNPALDAMFGYARGELVGQSTFVLDPLPPETCAQIAQDIRGRLQTETSLEREFLNRRKDGSEFISESRISRLQIAGQWCHVAVVQDVTERRRLEEEILAISERERVRIGNDLHDGLCQRLVGAALVTNLLEEQFKEKSIAEVSDVRQIAALLDGAITESRAIAHGLHPVAMHVEGLAFALRELAIDVSRLFSVACQFDCPAPVLVADNVVATHLFRIAQEAVNNAIKHGHASEISIELTGTTDRTVTLKITDNGIGLTGQPRESKGMGLAIMRYRARAIGGRMEIQPGPSRGTTVVCSFRQESGT